MNLGNAFSSFRHVIRQNYMHMEFWIATMGILTFIYVTDPEGNLIELQNWNYSEK